MSALRCISIALAAACGATADAAEKFDGTTPLECLAEQAYDCLPGASVCGPLKRETTLEPLFYVDFAEREVRSPFRAAVMHAAHATTNAESIILQGTDLMFAWSALINRKTGALTISIVDRKGGYLAFGHCKVVKRKYARATD